MFAMSHALVEWVVLYEYIYPNAPPFLKKIEIGLLLISYVCLFEFSRFILQISFKKIFSSQHILYQLFSVKTIYAMSIIFFIICLIPSTDVQHIIVAIRYTFGFWGSFFIGMGLYFYSNALRGITHIQDIRQYFRVIGISFLLYAIFAGIIGPKTDIFLAKYINDEWFFDSFGVPVQVFRTICAVVVAIASIKALEIFRIELSQKVVESFEQIREFNANASHQLKTPLSSIKVQIDVALQKDRNVNEYKTLLHSVNDDINFFLKMLTNLLMLTRLEDGEIQKKFHNIRVDRVLLNMVDEYIPYAYQKKIDIQIQNIEQRAIRGNESLMYTMFSNILDNAIKYTPPNNDIFISLENGQLKIINTGSKVPLNKINTIFEKFTRLDNSSIAGHGLGLALVKKIALLHDFNISIKNLKDNGVIFTVDF